MTSAGPSSEQSSFVYGSGDSADSRDSRPAMPRARPAAAAPPSASSSSSSSSVITLTLESICFHHVVREKVQSAREKKKIKWGEKFVVESISQRIILACHPPQTSLKDRVIVHVQYSQNAWHHKSNCGSWRLVGVLAK
jgi:hypothetical protein